MKTTIKSTLLAATLGIAVLAPLSAFAQPTAHENHATVRTHHVRQAPGLYLYEEHGPVNGNAAGNTGAAENFQDQFAISY
jgi:hypothetical protein